MIDPTLGTDVSLNIDSIKEIMDGIDPEALLPEMSGIFTKILLTCRIAVLIGPVILLVLGIVYLFLTPKEANFYLGYRCYFGMGSTEAWQFTQRLAGLLFGGLGVVLTAVMLILSMGFGRLDMMALVWRTVWCLAAQVILTGLAVLTVNAMSLFWFDRKGNLRKHKVRKQA